MEAKKNYVKLIARLSEAVNLDYDFHKISIAPMLDITNMHFRFFMRLLTKKATLYTEMIHENTILHYKGGYEELLEYHPIEHPLVIQLGGNNPERLKKCALICESLKYDEININIGCPSPKVQEGSFGACLMKSPDVVAEFTKEISETVKIPVTVKCRLGVDDFDNYEFVKSFVDTVGVKGKVRHFVVHARKAFLKGLNPSENRSVPPLKYDWVLQLKKDFSDYEFSINGGFKEIKTITEILKPEKKLKGCMVGRLAYEHPFILSTFDKVFYNTPNQNYSRREILEIWSEYCDYAMEKNPLLKVPNLVKPVINLFSGEKNGAKYRQFLSDSQNSKQLKNVSELFLSCIEMMESVNKEALDFKPDDILEN